MIDHLRTPPVPPPALALLVGANDWSVRAIETILDPRAFVTLRAPNAGRALQLLHAAAPDLIIIYGDLLDSAFEDACRALGEASAVSPTRPVIAIATNGGTRERRLGLQRAGVWYVLSDPVDADALGMLIGRLLAARRELRLATERILLDDETGVYNERGLLRRSVEMGAHATRYHQALAFIAIRPIVDRDNPTGTHMAASITPLASHLARIIGGSLRLSDALGRIRPRELGLVAEAVDQEHAGQFVQRLRDAVEASPLVIGGAIRRLTIATAVCAVDDFAQSSVDAPDLMRRVADSLWNDEGEADLALTRIVEAVPLRGA